MITNQDTITAISTPVGQGGIGIVRISGPDAERIAKKIFMPHNSSWPLESHHLYLGDLSDPATGFSIDEVLLSFMRSPNSYTREDVVEINSHSGYVLLSRILQLAIDNGARMALPGEFTFRAFLNGRIDLPQAEAVMDLINSKSELGLKLATQQLKGALGEELEKLKGDVIKILANIEVGIDFPDEEADIMSMGDVISLLNEDVIEPIESLIEKHVAKRIWLDGIKTVIVGRVNAGKSSLLNRLLEEERAIVTPIPGTTRDVIEATINIDGVPLRLMDTAGLREGKDEVEKIGLSMTGEKIDEADLLLVVIDQSVPVDKDDLDLLDRCKEKNALVLLNKIDLPSHFPEEEIADHSSNHPVVRISALTGEGVDDLKKFIVDTVVRGDFDPGFSRTATNMRHKQALTAGAGCFKRAVRNIKDGSPFEIIALELKSGLDSIEEIIGTAADDEILERVFSQFCLGK
ncbi:tRNA uridine-5-carboxymethylaminomethyl(34) synthesis GTPase MnmE [Thermodesulfobacteriota bacterium]